MQCPECQSDNPADARFCNKCGSKLEIACPQCSKVNPPDSNFCNGCGHSLVPEEKPIEKPEPATPTGGGERKHVTVLFSDLSGYTAMSEKLDPEEIKDIMTRVFGRIKEVIAKYDGFIEKFAGDAVMAIFGVPRAHEDDPVRAIRAAREIHDLVKFISPEVEGKTGTPLSMHSGINTGLVVTGEVNPDKGTHGVAGDPLNLASRLCSLAPGEDILVGQDTFRRSEGYFTFEELEPTRVKGKAEPVSIYKVLAAKDRPAVIQRPSAPTGTLIGRKFELAQLTEAADQIQTGRGAIVSISGDAGTGKSRLVEEFRAGLDLDQVQWLEGHAYAYSQNMPYFQLIDMLNRALLIEEGDSPDKVREKLESGLAVLIGEQNDVVPYIGSLYSLDYPEAEAVSPEFWKSRLRDAIQTVLAALTRSRPAIICLDDIQWADPSSLDLLRYLLADFNYPALFICLYRLPFNLFTSQQQLGLGKSYQEIQLQDLSATEAQSMVEAMLASKNIPGDLRKFVQEKVEGNPFYLEEVIHALIESKTLVRDNGGWQLTQSIQDLELSSSVYGIISSRLDRLELDTKRVLQEAAVIGRAFLYDILEKISRFDNKVDSCLSGLERLDIIRARSVQPELEYIFKHAVTQEVVYNNLLKKDRREIHERIGSEIEQLFKDRLPEFYETLAHHFKQGRSVHKAVEYLVKSGEKSLERYAVEEAHQFYQQAYDILEAKTEKTEEDKSLLIELMNSWGYVFYFLGDVRTFTRLFESHRKMAESLNDTAKLGMFNVWLGIAIYMAGKMKDANEFLRKALEFGEENNDQKVIGYACTWLSWIGAEMGNYAEGKAYGDRAHKIAQSFPSDQYLFFKSFMGLCYISFFEGNAKKVINDGEILLNYGKNNANNRSMVFGHWAKSLGQFIKGDMESANISGEEALNIALDPLYSQFPKLSLGIQYLFSGRAQEAEDILQSAIDYSEKYGVGQFSAIANLFLAPTLVAGGRMNEGLKVMEDTRQNLIKNQRKSWLAQSENILGLIYSQVSTGPKPTLSTMAKNIGFLVKNVPQAGKKAEEHFKKSIDLSKDLGAGLILGSACLNLGLFYLDTKKPEQAKQYLFEAIKVFEKSEADIYLMQAQEAIASMKD
jgi:class 3 adenylate cyclase/tetratricopeptide (TPR) repeat protein